MTTFCSHFLCTMKSHSVGEGGRREDGMEGEREDGMEGEREERAKEEKGRG